MKPRTKILSLFFGLILPYVALVLYFAVRLPQRSLPTWLLYFGGLYIFGSVVLVVVVGRRISQDAAQSSEKSQAAPRWVRGRATSLVAFWSALFFYGAYKTLRGDFPLERALPAGAILLAFIGLFSWLLHGDSQSRHEGVKR
jgi:hypothetical protein